MRRAGRVLRFVVSGALLVAAPVACGGSSPPTGPNEPHVNEPPQEPTSNEPPQEQPPTDPQQPEEPTPNEPPDEPAVAPES